jgi:uncharacterized protein DUF4190/zinc ribbon protein
MIKLTQRKTPMNCPKCDAPVPSGATTCRECGRPLATATSTRSQSPLKSSESAIASLICAILGWSVLPIVGAILAIVLGHMARDEIRRSDGAVGGGDIAALGLALGYGNLAVAVLGTITVVLLAGLGIAIPVGLSICGLCAAFGV